MQYFKVTSINGVLWARFILVKREIIMDNVLIVLSQS